MDQHAVQIQIGVEILLTIATVRTALTMKECRAVEDGING